MGLNLKEEKRGAPEDGHLDPIGAVMVVGAGIAGLAAAALQAAWLIATLDPDDPRNCLQRFRANSVTGWIIFAGLVADGLLS